ncbi:MAG: CDGSH iron-sulfur domain-containing protein [Dinoroseobacter sp.]|nr:CDGSH iron-sulfur domain-containing protein [Dinoroseobacter sp.]
MARPKTYTGEKIEIGFELERCIHARNCFLKLPQVFDPSKRPWVDPEAVPAEEIAAMIRTCPSGALTFKRLDDGVQETATRINRVMVTENGPIAVQGDLSIAGRSQTRATLCRCGMTKNPPYCDYSHVEGGFKATGEPVQEAVNTLDSLDGTLEISAFEDGPMQVKGPMEITTGTGHRVTQTKTAFLCRCGQSQNKPFCDGSHKKAGFKMPGT